MDAARRSGPPENISPNRRSGGETSASGEVRERTEEATYVFYTRQLENMKDHLQIDEIEISVMSTATPQHIRVFIKIADSIEKLHYIHNGKGCRVGALGMMSTWRCSGCPWTQLVGVEFGRFLTDCCARGVAINRLSISTDSADARIPREMGMESLREGLSLKELLIEHKDSDFWSAYHTMKQFNAQVVIVKIGKITKELAQEMRKFVRKSSESTHKFVFQSTEPVEVAVILSQSATLEGFYQEFRPQEVVFSRNDFWTRQREALNPCQAIDVLEISVNTKAFLPNVCISIQIHDFLEKTHIMKSDTGCLLGIPERMSTWMSSDQNWLEKAQSDILHHLTTLKKPIRKLKMSLDLEKNSDSEDADGVTSLMEGIHSVVARFNWKFLELSVSYPGGTIPEAYSIMKGIQFESGFMHVASFGNREELEKMDMKLANGETCTISFEHELPSSKKHAINMRRFPYFDAKVSTRNELIVLTKKTEPIVPVVNEPIQLD